MQIGLFGERVGSRVRVSLKHQVVPAIKGVFIDQMTVAYQKIRKANLKECPFIQTAIVRGENA